MEDFKTFEDLKTANAVLFNQLPERIKVIKVDDEIYFKNEDAYTEVLKKVNPFKLNLKGQEKELIKKSINIHAQVIVKDGNVVKRPINLTIEL